MALGSRSVSYSPALSFFDLNVLGSQGEDHFRALAGMIERNGNLKTIIVNTSLVNDERTERLCETAFSNPNVKRLHYVSAHESLRIPHWVSAAPNLETLIFRGKWPPIVDIQAMVHSCRSLKVLRLYGGLHPDRTIQALETYLRSSSTLKELKIDRGDDSKFQGIHQAETVRSLGEALGNNVLEKLSLHRSEFGPGLVVPLGVLLSVNTSLTELDFSFCSLKDDNVVALCQGLALNNTLKSLNLTSNCCLEKGVTAVATLIASNDHLVQISIRNHYGGDKSIVKIGNALKHNTSLESLDVYPIGPKCVRALLDGIKEHPSLICVSDSPGFNDAQKHELWYYLELNCGTESLLTAPLNHWPLLLHWADRCRPPDSVGWGDSPSMLYYFVKEKCDLFNVSTRHVDASPAIDEETATPRCKRGRGDHNNGPSNKRTMARR